VVGIDVINPVLQRFLVEAIAFVKTFCPDSAWQALISKGDLSGIFIMIDNRTNWYRNIFSNNMNMVCKY